MMSWRHPIRVGIMAGVRVRVRDRVSGEHSDVAQA